MNQEQLGKHTIQWFRHATHHCCVFNKTYVGTASAFTCFSHPGLISQTIFCILLKLVQQSYIRLVLLVIVRSLESRVV